MHPAPEPGQPPPSRAFTRSRSCLQPANAPGRRWWPSRPAALSCQKGWVLAHGRAKTHPFWLFSLHGLPSGPSGSYVQRSASPSSQRSGTGNVQGCLRSQSSVRWDGGGPAASHVWSASTSGPRFCRERGKVRLLAGSTRMETGVVMHYSAARPLHAGRSVDLRRQVCPLGHRGQGDRRAGRPVAAAGPGPAERRPGPPRSMPTGRPAG